MTGQTENPESNAAKRLARLVAVQALYQASYEEEPLAAILKRSLEDADQILNGEAGEGELIRERPDPVLFSDIVQGVLDNREALDEMVAGALDARFSAQRLELLLKFTLLAGAYELYGHADIPAAVIISDYVDVAKAFFGAKEPGLVNGVLDKLAQKLRS